MGKLKFNRRKKTFSIEFKSMEMEGFDLSKIGMGFKIHSKRKSKGKK